LALIWDLCYDFKNIFPKLFAKFAQITACSCKKLIITLVFEKNAIFRRKLAQIEKNVIITSTPASQPTVNREKTILTKSKAFTQVT
jgi:hypothetical protein